MGTPLNNSVLKAFEILELITPERQEITANVIAAELGMNTATAHRFLTTLNSIGALTSYRRGFYSLGPLIDDLGQMHQETNTLSTVVKPVIERASRDLYESVMVSKLTRGGPVCIAVSPSSRPINMNIMVGTVLPLHSTGQGKLWLAGMPKKERDARLAVYPLAALTAKTIQDRETLEAELIRISEQGFATNIGENEPDLGAVSVPVLNEDNEIFLTISTFGALSRFDQDFIGRAVRRLRSSAQEIRDGLV